MGYFATPNSSAHLRQNFVYRQLEAFARAPRGLLIGYGPSLRELGRQAAGYVERILNGAQAGELPFQGPTHFDFAINMRAAKAVGLTIPSSLLVGADEVIE